MAVLLGEHRLERCLAAADRVVALDGGRDRLRRRRRAASCEWALSATRRSRTPGARLFALAGLAPAAASVKEARAALARGAASSRRRARRADARRRERRRRAAEPALAAATSGSSSTRATGRARSCAGSTSRSSRASGSR